MSIPLLLNAIVGVLAGVLMVLGFQSSIRAKTATSFLRGLGLILVGLSIAILALTQIPGRWLESLKQAQNQEVVTSLSEDDSAVDDDSSDEESVLTRQDDPSDSGNIIVIGSPEKLREFFREFVQEDQDQSVRTGDDDCAPSAEAARDPFVQAVVALPPVDPTPTPTPVPAATPELPTWERTLSEESEAPSCTAFVLVHGKGGGPEPDGCYAVGCQEGYALPMQLQNGAWNACANYSRLPRLKDCYQVTDKDGTQRSLRFVNGNWKPGTCT